MNTGFITEKKGEVSFLKVPSFERAGGLLHGFSTREGGVSSGVFSSMNLGPSCGDEPENVVRNFMRFCGALGADPKGMVFSRQVHRGNIEKIADRHKGNGFLRENEFTDADGLITDRPGVVLVTFYADCVPILLYDPKQRVIASIHSGWRGTVLKIASRGVSMMETDYGSKKTDILAAIGPSIGPCCYEVGREVKGEFDAAFFGETGDLFRKKAGNQYMLDLWSANAGILREIGIPDENITLAGECTACSGGKYFSHRASGGKRGSMIALMELI